MASLCPICLNPEQYSFNPISPLALPHHHIPSRPKDKKKSGKLTIKHRLTNRHNRHPKPPQNTPPGNPPPHHPPHPQPPQPPPEPPPLHLSLSPPPLFPLLPPPHHHGQIHQIPHQLHQIHPRLRRREPIPFLPRRPAVDVIHRAVQGVRRPDRGVPAAAGHAVRAQQDVEQVPEHEGQGEQEPEEG